MAFTSYAQNFEDVMLWRALKHIDKGCYIDVGAQHPVIDSVSKAFYEKGWRGTHVEPVPQYADLLREDRPDETVLQVALSDSEGTLELNLIPETGLSTGVDSYAERHLAERGFGYQKIKVPLTTLKLAFNQHDGKDIHWLKIDVEGFETQVLKGWDSQKLRPWIMVVEATIPNSSQTDSAAWEPILAAADYQFVYFDGLNRFYVAQEHPELMAAFSAPPNVFDDIVLTAHSTICRELLATHQNKERQLEQMFAVKVGEYEKESAQLNARAAYAENNASLALSRSLQAEEQTRQAEEQTRQAEEQTRQAEEQTRQAEEQTRQAEARAHQVTTELGLILASTSWRATGPLRRGIHVLRRLIQAIREDRLASGINRRRAQLAQRMENTSLPQSMVGKVMLRILKPSDIQVQSITTGLIQSPNPADRLPKRTSRIYSELKQIIDDEEN